MNLVRKYVHHITSVSEPNEHGWRILICDTDCYGVKDKGIVISVSDDDYKIIKEHGYYLC